jgi:DNA invertase Pin-like site-specific DNA recombinase
MSEKKTAIYCRMAARPMCDDTDILKQKEFLLRYAKEHGYENTVLYEDDGVSGLTMHDRPAFKQMQASIESGEIERVIVRSLSRIGRNTYDVYRWLSELQARDVEFIAANTPALDIDILRKLFDDMRLVVDDDA